MSITSLSFILFIFILFIVYYIVPKKFQWVILLIGSFYFYYQVGIAPCFYILFTASSIYLASLLMDRILIKQKERFIILGESLSKEDKKSIKNKNQRKRKAVMLFTLLINIGLLCYTKYTSFLLEQFNSVLISIDKPIMNTEVRITVPLGISFYTFQSIGYLLDVYWEKIEPQNNYFKFLLFVSFFPQITQGPISDYEQLSNELYIEHELKYDNFAYGCWRILLGFYKKLLIANIMGYFVSNTFVKYETYTGITTLLGMLCYSIEIYADFSGYMDIMCGLCLTLGIKLRENFDRPYFSKSIAEYWRRWHISLGDWFKKYIYYPIGMSNWSRSLAKKTKHKFGTHFANTLPATFALLIVWTTTGLWHGASWAYIVWGLLNGVFIIFSMWMEPVYEKIRNILHIDLNNKYYKCLQIIRTFILVTFIKVLPEVGTLNDGLNLWKHVFTSSVSLNNIGQLFEFAKENHIWLFISIIGTMIMFFLSINKSFCVIDYRNIPYPVKVIIASIFVFLIVSFGNLALYEIGGGGFMYAGF